MSSAGDTFYEETWGGYCTHTLTSHQLRTLCGMLSMQVVAIAAANS